MKKIFLVLALMCLFPVSVHAKPDLTGRAGFQIGRSSPHSNLKNFLYRGTAYRIDLFGGAKLAQVKLLSAIGMGLDFTYTDWEARNREAGFRYRQYQWDMFKLPVSIGWFLVEPAFLWMVTDVGIPHKGVSDTSIRPGASLNLGLRIPLFSHFNFRIDGRAQRVMADNERTATGDEINITGQTYSGFAGFEAYF